MSVQASSFTFLLVEPKALVVYLLFLLVGLLLTYRHKNKAKDRPCNDEEKTKKESKGKKLFTKLKEKESINGVWNYWNEPIDESAEDKMGLSQSKKRNTKLQLRTSASAPTSGNNLRNGSYSATVSAPTLPNNLRNSSNDTSSQKHDNSSVSPRTHGTGNPTFIPISDEIKTNTTGHSVVNRQSSLKILHRSLSLTKQQQSIDNDICKDIEHLKNKIENDDQSYLNDSDNGITFSSTSTNFTSDLVHSKCSSSDTSKLVQLVDSTPSNSVSLSRRPDVTSYGRKPLDVASITRKEETKKVTVCTKVPSQNVELNASDVITDTTTDDAKAYKSPRIVSKPKVPPFNTSSHDSDDLQKIFTPVISNNDLVDDHDLLTDSSNEEHSISGPPIPKDDAILPSVEVSMLKDAPLDRDMKFDVPSEENNFSLLKEDILVEEEKLKRSYVLEKPCPQIHNRLVNSYADILIKSIVDNMYLDIRDNFKQEVLNFSEKSGSCNENDSDLTILSEIDIDKSTSDNITDITLLANSVSYNILKNVLKDIDLLTEITPSGKCGRSETDVIRVNNVEDRNEVQHIANVESDGLSALRSESLCVNNLPHLEDSEQNVDNGEMGNTNTSSNDTETEQVIEKGVVITKTVEPSEPDDGKDKQHTPVVLRRKGSRRKKRDHLATSDDNKNRYSFTDRPLSGFTEQLAELLAEDIDFDDLDLDLESVSELPDALEKIKEITADKPDISNEIGKIQRRCSRVELNEYGLKKFKSKVQSKLDDKKTKLKGDRPLSLYEQDLLGDLIGDEEFEEYNEVDEEGVESVQSSVQLLEDKIPLINRRADSTDSLDDTLDERTKTNQVEAKVVSTSKVPSLGKAAVIDLGSGILKAGMCGEMEPSCYCPSVIGVPRRLSQDVSKMKKGYYVGDEAWTMAGMLSIDHPVKQDITNWSDVTSIIEHLLDLELKVDENHPVLLTEMSLVSPKQREKLTEIMFETFNVPAFYLANQAPLALYSTGLTTGLCLNSGFECTQSVPVYEGCVLPYATEELHIGGEQVCAQLARILLGTQGHVFNTSSEKLVLNTMKQSLCYVAQDPTSEVELYKTTANHLRTYTLPDGQELELSTERFLAPEILFDPGILGLKKPNVAEIVHNTIDRVERTLSPILKDNILVCGGTTKFSGFGPRLEKELETLNRTLVRGSGSSSYNVHYVDNPLLATWIGGSVLSSISSFYEQWITIDTYAEVGSKIVHKVCF